MVAIGGISRSNCAAVVEAGADSVAVISDLVPREGRSTGKIIEEFFLLLGDHVAP
jgi:thiamine monophosphate synthase